MSDLPPMPPPTPSALREVMESGSPELISATEETAKALLAEYGGDEVEAAIALATWLLADVSAELVALGFAIVAVDKVKKAAP